MQNLVQKELNIALLKKFMERHYLKNRTLVSKDIPGILDDIEDLSGLPMIRHRYRTGEDAGTWVVPPRWDIKEAWLKDPRGRIMASYADHPLFVCPYSQSIHRTLSKEELLTHISTQPKQPTAFCYNWRLGCDARLRLKDWGISLPQSVVDGLSDGQYEILIDAEVEVGEMLVGEIVLRGESEKSLMFLADYCHPGQVNDSFSGLTVLTHVMHTLSKRPRKYTYRFLIMPETFGPAVYIAHDPTKIQNVLGVVFCDSVGWGEKWYIKSSRLGNTYLDELSEECRRVYKDVYPAAFCEDDILKQVYGNDELIFDSVQVNIPSLSVQKFPFPEYHTSLDEPSRLIDSNLQYAHDMICHMTDVLEQDCVYRFRGAVPFWMTRFDLYSDCMREFQDNRFRFSICYRLLDGRNSVLEIANKLNVPFEQVSAFVKKMENAGLVSVVDNSPGASYFLKK